jgi:hypothetical protein
MPALDYVLLADYVRQDAGTIHIMSAGLDTFTIPGGILPTAVPVGMALRITFSSREPVGELHRLAFTFSGPGGDVLLIGAQDFATPPQAAGVPDHWRTAVGIAVRMLLPIPSYGNYAVEVQLDDDPELMRRLDLRVVEPPL